MSADTPSTAPPPSLPSASQANTAAPVSASNPPSHATSTTPSTTTWPGPALASAASLDEDPSPDDLLEQERLLEELLRLQLQPLTGQSASPGAGHASEKAGLSDSTGLLGGAKARAGLFQPRTKLEQLEDILMETQFLDSSTFSSDLTRAISQLGREAGDSLPLKTLTDLDMLDLDYESTDAIFRDSSASSSSGESLSSPHVSSAPPSSTGVNPSISVDPEVERLRQCWSALRSDIVRVYLLVMGGAWKDVKARPDLSHIKERVHELRWRDSHQLFQRLEFVVRELILSLKQGFLLMLNKEASSPNLARQFIQDLLDGFDSVCHASQIIAPSMVDLEKDHLSRFSLTWEILNKHLYQSLVYADPVIQNNLPILISQLRSLFPEPEHEATYTALVRRYLDFDVEMENIGTFWQTSETLLEEYNQQQDKLRLKQKMLKDDWEKFKAQRREFEEEFMTQDNHHLDMDLDGEMMSSEFSESMHRILTGLEELTYDEIPPDLESELRRVMNLEDVSSSPLTEEDLSEDLLTPPLGFSPLNKAFLLPEQSSSRIAVLSLQGSPQDNLEYIKTNAHRDHPNASCKCHVCQDMRSDSAELSRSESSVSVPGASSSSNKSASNGVKDMEDAFASIYPHLYNSLTEVGGLLDGKEGHKEILPSISPLMSSLLQRLKDNCGNDKEYRESLDLALKLSYLQPNNEADQASVTKSSTATSVSSSINSTTKTSKETPSSVAKSTTVSQVTTETVTSAFAATSLSSSSSSSSSSASSVGNSEVSEVTKSSNKKSTANVSKNGSTSTSKAITCPKSKSTASCKANHHMGPHAKELNKLLNQHYCNHKKPSPASSTNGRKSNSKPPSTPSGDISSDDDISDNELDDDYEDHEHGEDGGCCSGSGGGDDHPSGDPRQCSCCYCEVFGHGGPSMAPVSRNYPEMRERLRLLLRKKKQCKERRGEASQKISQKQPESLSVEKSEAGGGKVNPSVSSEANSRLAPEQQDELKTKDVDEILDFIEGNVRQTNEKKKAKKERQKQQRAEELKKKAEEERRKKKAEEEKRRLQQEEEKRAQEAALQSMKKQKKKAAQRAKKAAAKGLPVPEEMEEDSKSQLTLEELKMQQLREIQELKLMHQRQLQEEERKLQEILHEQQRIQASGTKGGNGSASKYPNVTITSNGTHFKKKSKESNQKSGFTPNQNLPNPPSSKPISSPSTSLSAILNQSQAGSGGGQQIKISRTPSGGVEFTPVVVSDQPGTAPPRMATTPSATTSFSPFNHLMPSFPSMSASPSSGPMTPSSVNVGAFPSGAVPVSGISAPSQFTSQDRRPSVPSKASPAQPMFTIKRIQTPDGGQASATISLKDKQNEKLMYKFVNGEILRSRDAPADLLPEAKPMGDGKKKKKKAAKSLANNRTNSPLTEENGSSRIRSGTRPGSDLKVQSSLPLPLNAQGKLDLDKLQLPNGISITKIDGQVNERKYFPSKPDMGGVSSSVFPPDTAVKHAEVNFNELTPELINNPNVIVVDTSSLKTEAEEKSELSSQNGKNGKAAKKAGKKSQETPYLINESQSPKNSRDNGVSPQLPAESDANALKKGPQVLIKNVNGKVVITPIPEPVTENGNVSSTTMPNGGNNNLPTNTNNNNNTTNNNNKNMTSTLSGPSIIKPPVNMNGHTGKSKQNSKRPDLMEIDPSEREILRQDSIGDNIDEISSVFAPKDIDLDNGEMDEDEREVEAFKRFCFNHIPPQQKAKVHLDVKNIAFNKKK